jgi:hypothetical protein
MEAARARSAGAGAPLGARRAAAAAAPLPPLPLRPLVAATHARHAAPRLLARIAQPLGGAHETAGGAALDALSALPAAARAAGAATLAAARRAAAAAAAARRGELGARVAAGLGLGAGGAVVVAAGGAAFTASALFVVYHATREYFGLVSARASARGDGDAAPAPLVSAAASALALGLVAAAGAGGASGATAVGVAAFVVLGLHVFTQRPSFSQMTASLYGLLYCGAARGRAGAGEGQAG